MTEDQARAKWCPMVRHTCVSDDAAFNRDADNWAGVNLNCVGSDCMMWRWTENDPNVVTYKAYGFCGLAGKP